MPIITKPSPLEKDATGIFSLDKTALALHPTVVASAHFSSPNVWDKIILKYKSETLGQFESIEFDATVASPEGQFFVSATAENIFEVEKITIIDKDGAILLIPRADLTAAEFDIDFGLAVPEVSYYLYNQLGTGHTTDAFGGIISSITNGFGSLSFNTNAISGDFDIEFNFNSQNLVHQSIFGVKTSLDGGDNWFAFLYREAGLATYFNGNTKDAVTQNPGSNVFRIKRTSSLIEFYANGIKLPQSISYAQSVYLTVRANTGFNLISTVDKLEAAGTYLTYELNTAGATLNATGGVSGGNGGDNFYAKDSSGAAGDFTYEWKFNWSSINASNILFGVTGTYDSGTWWDKLTCLQGVAGLPTNAIIWVNGTPGVVSNISIPNQDNIYKLTRVGTTISHYLNGSLIHSSTVALFTAYPTVRTMGLSACLESYSL